MNFHNTQNLRLKIFPLMCVILSMLFDFCSDNKDYLVYFYFVAKPSIVYSHFVFLYNENTTQFFKSKFTTTRVWAINKIDHAPVAPFAGSVSSVQAGDKESVQRIDEKKSLKGSRENEESLARASKHKETNICLRSVLHREGVTALFSFSKISSMSNTKAFRVTSSM